MKKVNYILILCFVLGCSGCKMSLEGLYDPIGIDNKSSIILSFYIPWMGINGRGYPDTILVFSEKDIGCCVQPGKIMYPVFHQTAIGYERWISSFPKDTVSIYIFNQDTLDAYPWDIIQRDYKILQRYDLSLEDIYTLKENNIPVIPYPPNEQMKNMKMYPPYE